MSAELGACLRRRLSPVFFSRSARDQRGRTGRAVEGMSGAAQIHCELSGHAHGPIRHLFDPGSSRASARGLVRIPAHHLNSRPRS